MSVFSRRNFLTRSAALATAGALPAWASPLGLPMGIQLYTVGAEMKVDLPGTLKNVHAIGFREVETAGFANVSAAQFRKLLDDTGLRCVSCHLPFAGGNWNKDFDDAKTVGAHYAVSSSLVNSKSNGKKTSDLMDAVDLDGMKALAETANKIGEAAAKAGLQYAYHNHVFEFKKFNGGTQTGYDILLKQTDKDKVKFEIDCGWMILGGFNPVDYLRKLPDRFRMLHVKDFVKSTNRPSTTIKGHQGTELGRGFIDYRPIFEAAKRARIEHCFVEQEPPFPDMPALEAAKTDYKYLSTFS